MEPNQPSRGRLVTKTLEEVAEVKDASLCKVMLDQATQIWLAGVGALWLGAFNKVQDESTKIFDALVKEGGRLQKHAGGMTEQTLAEARARAADTWEKLEDVFEDRVSRALGRLSIPTRQDTDELRDKLEKLTAAVERLSDPHRGGKGDGGVAEAPASRSDTALPVA
jgi:poly(hydroxyalkanoate) granule-associated protein